MQEKILYWLEMAEYDLTTAQVMLKGKRFLYVGFMCHQAIEKVLKGYYVSVKNETPPFTHNLTHLSRLSGIYDNLSEKQKDFIDVLEPLNIEARYPTHKASLLKDLTYAKCKEILLTTERLHKWIKKQL